MGLHYTMIVVCFFSALFHKYCAIPVLFGVVSVLQGEDGQAHLAHCFEHVNAYAVKGRSCHFHISARQIALGCASFTQSAIRKGESKIIAVVERLTFKFEGDFLRKFLLVSVDDNPPLISRKHFFQLTHTGIARS